MSVEERLRAAARARTDVVTSVRPLELPAESPARVRRRRHARRWLGWGAPIAAAALVTAVALALVLLRQAGGAQSRPSAPASGSPTAAAVPRYYVELDRPYAMAILHAKLVVGDDRTGREIAVLNPSASQDFYGVTAAADDRTFVVMSYQHGVQETTWYLLRLTPGAAHPAALTKLPIKPVAAHVNGLALSPDGRELAVMYRTPTSPANGVATLTVYSMSSGAAHGIWHTSWPNSGFIASDGNGAGLSWTGGGRGVDFRWITASRRSTSGKVKVVVTVRALEVTSGGHDLMADSRPVVQLPQSVSKTTTFINPCAQSLAARDGTVVCGTDGGRKQPGAAACPAASPSFVSYSAATGKPLKVLGRYQGQCLVGVAEVLWTDPTGSHVIGLFFLDTKDKKEGGYPFGIVGGGHFTRLPALPVVSGATFAGGIAF